LPERFREHGGSRRRLKECHVAASFTGADPAKRWIETSSPLAWVDASIAREFL